MALLQRPPGPGAGRRADSRDPRWGPRVLDLDLLWFGQRRSATPELLLPHPRWQQRQFRSGPSGGPWSPIWWLPHAPCSCQELLCNCAPPYPQLL